jgi:hypothetical protein
MRVHHVGDISLSPDPSWKGRVINALGEPLDDLGSLLPGPRPMPNEAAPPSAMNRARVEKPLTTRVKAIDLFTPICQGQRIGIFAGSGVGVPSLGRPRWHQCLQGCLEGRPGRNPVPGEVSPRRTHPALLGVPPSKGVVDPAIVDATGDGENSHGILQALCRSAVREMQENGCPTVDAYLIASDRTGIPDLLPKIFPGARVVPWEPVPRELTGKVAHAVAFVRDRFQANPDVVLRFTEVQKAVRIKDPSNFRKTIRQHEDFRAALDSMGLEEWGPRRYMSSFRRRSLSFQPVE